MLYRLLPGQCVITCVGRATCFTVCCQGNDLYRVLPGQCVIACVARAMCYTCVVKASNCALFIDKNVLKCNIVRIIINIIVSFFS